MFIEYIESIMTHGDEYKVWQTHEQITIDDAHEIVIFFQIIPNRRNIIQFTNTRPVRVYICNTEQMSAYMEAFVVNIEPFFHQTQTAEQVRFGIIDYSRQNIDTMRTNQFIVSNGIETHYVPYQYNYQEVERLKSHITKGKKIFMCGSGSKKRLDLIDRLKEQHNITVDLIAGFGDTRDKQMMRYKLMLNISTRDDYNIYEHIRCDRLIFAKMLIISDYKQDKESLDVHDFIVWTQIDGIENTIYDVMANYEMYKSRITNQAIQSIAHTRRQAYMGFRYVPVVSRLHIGLIGEKQNIHLTYLDTRCMFEHNETRPYENESNGFYKHPTPNVLSICSAVKEGADQIDQIDRYGAGI